MLFIFRNFTIIPSTCGTLHFLACGISAISIRALTRREGRCTEFEFLVFLMCQDLLDRLASTCQHQIKCICAKINNNQKKMPAIGMIGFCSVPVSAMHGCGINNKKGYY